MEKRKWIHSTGRVESTPTVKKRQCSGRIYTDREIIEAQLRGEDVQYGEGGHRRKNG